MTVLMDFYLLIASASFVASLLCIGETLFPSQVWHAEYFEFASDDLPYRAETFSCRESLETAIVLYQRLGGDDVLKITGPGFKS
jgi:hypothetical protein